MTKLFDETRHYQPADPEIIVLLGGTSKQAQMRHFRRSPSFYRLGRKIIYHGADLNAWAEANKIETGGGNANGQALRHTPDQEKPDILCC